LELKYRISRTISAYFSLLRFVNRCCSCREAR